MNATVRDYLKYQAPVILWGIVIFTVSSIPRLPTLQRAFPHFDKVMHGLEYCVFGYLLARAFYHQGRRSVRAKAVRLALILGVLFAGLDELHQVYVPGRVESVTDFLADTTGLAVALGLFQWRRRGSGIGPPGSGSPARGEQQNPVRREMDADGVARPE